MSDLIKISGFFKKILFEKKQNNFRITSCKIAAQPQGLTIKTNKYGTISILSKDIDFEIDKCYDMILEYFPHSRYTESYNLVELKESEMWKLNYLVRFLKSSKFPGIGEVKSTKIVEKFGFDTLNILAFNDDYDADDFGISEEAYSQARAYLRANTNIIEDQLFFLKLNLSPSFYEKINLYFDSLAMFLEKYKDNFYDFYFDVEGIQVSDLDKITKHFFPEGHFFTKPMVLYKALEEYFFNKGHTKISNNDFYAYFYKNYEKISVDEFKDALKYLIQEKRVLIFDNKEFITTTKLRLMEEYVITRLYDVSKKHKDKFLPYADSYFHPTQIEAINSALNENLCLITGSPGTGKTLILNKIINLLLTKYSEEDIVVVTPTGRATININKDNEIKASTIHSFLQWDVDLDKFKVNENWPENKKVLIIDEFSMVGIDLFFHLLKGLSKSLKKIIVVGDKNQLPAIGPGYLIKDFIESNIFETIELSKIYRQAENYEIIRDAISVNKSEFPKFNGKHSQFHEVEKENLSKIIISEIKKLIKQGYVKKDIAILSPIYNYQTGIDNLNNELSTFWRKLDNMQTTLIGKQAYAIGDKVINTVNDPSKKIFNGEIGYIYNFIFEDDTRIISFVQIKFENEDRIVQFTRKEFLQRIILAYCTSVHKYQGSECPIVFTVLFDEARVLLSKKLIYTAITRAQKLSIIFGQKDAFIYGIENDDDSKRITCISELWNAKLNQGVK